MVFKTPREPLKDCCLCGKKVFSNKSIYCRRCSHFVYRMRNEQFSRKTIKAIKAYVRKNGFRCSYTKMLLEMDDDTRPWYCSFDHWIPRDPRKVVITSAWLNAMKTDLTEKEFWYYVLRLYYYRMKHIKIRKRRPVYWNRLCVVHKQGKCPICGRPNKGTQYLFLN